MQQAERVVRVIPQQESIPGVVLHAAIPFTSLVFALCTIEAAILVEALVDGWLVRVS